jgi:hypothetical protein
MAGPTKVQVTADSVGLAGALVPQGAIAAADDFPTSDEVQTGWWYTCSANVTDNDVTKTNTGLSFRMYDELAWNGSTWVNYGKTRYASDITANTSHSGGDGSDHADVGTNTAHLSDTGNPHSVSEADVSSERMIRDAIVVAGNDTVRTRLSFDKAVRISSIAVMCVTVATVGTYTLEAKRTSDVQNLLSAASYDLTGLVAGTWTEITLNGTPANLELAANADMYVDFISNNAGLDAAGVYLRVTATVV